MAETRLSIAYYPGGIRSVIPGPYDDWLAAGIVEHNTAASRLDRLAASANLTERQKIILDYLRVHDVPHSDPNYQELKRDYGLPYLATQLGITYGYLKVEISRPKKS